MNMYTAPIEEGTILQEVLRIGMSWLDGNYIEVKAFSYLLEI